MDLKRKIELLESHVSSIAGHTDEDAAVLLAALGKGKKIIEQAEAAVNARIQAAVAEFDSAN